MSYLNIHMSLGWVGDERIVSFELPEDWEEWGEDQRETFIDECRQEAIECNLDAWHCITEDAEDN